MPDQDYTETYNDFWREIVENPDGTLNLDQIMRELHDYSVVMREVSLAYDAVTGGRLSKPNTAYGHVVDAVDERIQAVADEARKEAAEEAAAAMPDPITPTNIPQELVHAAAQAWKDAPQKRDGEPTRMRHALAAAWPEIEKQVRAKVAAEIEAAHGPDERFPTGWASTEDRDHAARIARGES